MIILVRIIAQNIKNNIELYSNDITTLFQLNDCLGTDFWRGLITHRNKQLRIAALSIYQRPQNPDPLRLQEEFILLCNDLLCTEITSTLEMNLCIKIILDYSNDLPIVNLFLSSLRINWPFDTSIQMVRKQIIKVLPFLKGDVSSIMFPENEYKIII